VPVCVTVRVSLNKDARSAVRNRVNAILRNGGFSKPRSSTATWKASRFDCAASTALAEVVKLLEDLRIVEGADPNVVLDHLWIYVEKGL
jgi:hypothetical protein